MNPLDVLVQGTFGALTRISVEILFGHMTSAAILDLKQRLSRLSESDRKMAAAYLLRLKHESAAGKRELSRTMKAMDDGKKVRLRDLRKQLGHA